MAAWLYPISKRADRWFILDDGTKLKVSVENYAKLVKSMRSFAFAEMNYVATLKD